MACMASTTLGMVLSVSLDDIILLKDSRAEVKSEGAFLATARLRSRTVPSTSEASVEERSGGR